MRLVNNHDLRLDNADDLVESGNGHIAVHGRVEAARAYRSEEAGRRFDMSARHDDHGIARVRLAREEGADRFCQFVELTKGQRVLVILEHDFIMVFVCRSVKPAKNRSFHIFSFSTTDNLLGFDSLLLYKL